MKKVNILIILAGLFVSGVMLFLVFKGVTPKDRRMVKWSAVSSAKGAGKKISRFMFPILQTKKKFHIIGQGSFGETFFESFKKEAARISPEAEVNFGMAQAQNVEFVLEIRNLDIGISKEDCESPCSEAFVYKKALGKFIKKDRMSSELWISGYRLNEQKALFFFKVQKQ